MKKQYFLRASAAAAAAVMLLLPMGGCGKTEDPTPDVSYETTDLGGRKIRVYQYGFRKDSINNTDRGRRFMNRVAEIEKAFNCTIDLSEDDNYTAAWNAVMAGKPTFDIMQVSAPHLFSQPATNGVFLDLKQYDAQLHLSSDKWDKAMNENYRLQGRQLAVSTGTSLYENTALYFNKRLVRAAGYDPEQIYQWQEEGTWTWDKFREIAAKIAKLSTASQQIYGCINNDWKLYDDLCVTSGSNWITKDDSGVHFSADKAECVRAMDFMVGLCNDKIIPDKSEFNDYKIFLEGRAGFSPEYLQRMGDKEGYGGMQDDYGVVMFPKYDEKNEYVSINDWYQGWALLTGIEEPEKVALVLAALTDTLYPDQAELDQINESTYLSWVRDEQSLKVFELAAKNTYVSPLKFASPVDSQWQSKLGEILQGKVTAAQALQEVKNQYDVTLDELWELIDIGDDAG